MKKTLRSVRWLAYEKRGEKLAPPDVFRTRLVRSGGLCAILIGVSLLIGVLGYHCAPGECGTHRVAPASHRASRMRATEHCEASSSWHQHDLPEHLARFE